MTLVKNTNIWLRVLALALATLIYFTLKTEKHPIFNPAHHEGTTQRQN